MNLTSLYSEDNKSETIHEIFRDNIEKKPAYVEMLHIQILYRYGMI